MIRLPPKDTSNASGIIIQTAGTTSRPTSHPTSHPHIIQTAGTTSRPTSRYQRIISRLRFILHINANLVLLISMILTHPLN